MTAWQGVFPAPTAKLAEDGGPDRRAIPARRASA